MLTCGRCVHSNKSISFETVFEQYLKSHKNAAIIDPRTIRKLSQNYPTTVPNLSQNDRKTVPKLPQSCPPACLSVSACLPACLPVKPIKNLYEPIKTYIKIIKF